LKYPIAGFGTSNSNADQFISDRVNFIGSNFIGQVQAPIRNPDDYRTYGQLDSNHILILEKENPDYIVYSYSTPIAWHGTHGWHIPAIRYSQTTSRHQSIVRRAIS
jgi:hypothetical protein